MKYLLFIVFLLASVSAFSQKPSTVYAYSQEQHPMAWYKEQAAAWKKVTEKEPANAMAWYNLYYAKRILAFHDENDKRDYAQKEQEMNSMIKSMELAIPDTYELNLIKWMVAGLQMDKLHYLQRAAALGEGRTEHLHHMINVAELQGKTAERSKYALQDKENGMVSAGMLYYNYNLLAGLDTNAILVVVGDNDTYPAWVLQAMGVRTDVKVLNMSLLLADDYRKEVFKELGVKNIDIDWQGNRENAETDFYKAVPALLTKNSRNRPVYISLTGAYIANMAQPAIDDKLYITGLAYQYCERPLDNIALLQRNFENRYALDYIDKPLYNDISAALVKRMNENYVVPLLKLYDHYKAAGDLKQQQWAADKIMAVAKGSQYEADIKKHINR